jgi:hypothetical protein
MLTPPVNIAVFATFRCVISGIRCSIPVFKPVCGSPQLDVSRYGWQKRQDRGKNGKVIGTISTDSGTILSRSGAARMRLRALGRRGMTGIRLAMRLFRCVRSRMALC